MNLATELKNILGGDVLTDAETLATYSKDTSLFEVKPQVVVFPKNHEDVKKIVRFVQENQEKYPGISITGRAAGTDMTGGPLNESIILSFTKYFNKFHVSPEKLEAIVEPGVYYRDFEKETDYHKIEMPTYPASKSLCALGGMVMNNAGGEKTLRYGQTRNFVKSVKMVLADGNEYEFKKLSREELEQKKKQQNFEGEVYRKTHELIENNYDLIMTAKPAVSKNSSGYAIWDVWNRETGEFNLSQLFVGSQGTLGILTEAKMRLVKKKKHERLIALFFKKWEALPEAVNELLVHEPESLETFDDATIKLGIRFMPEVATKAGMSFMKFALKFLPEAWLGIKMLGMPKLIVLVQLSGDDAAVLDEKVKKIMQELSDNEVWARVARDKEDADKYWTMRRESFALLRKHVSNKRTAPFVDDFCINPDRVPEFLPKAIKLLADHGIKANITGHAGNGNLHIIPLMDLHKESERKKIREVADKFHTLIREYNGTMTAEHNDGILRTPYLKDMFGEKMYGIFKEIKQIFDPNNIFNPGKKVGGTVEYMEAHIAK